MATVAPGSVPIGVSDSIKKLLAIVGGLDLTSRFLDDAIELYYGDQTFVHDCVRSWKKINKVNSGLRGSFGVVHKVNIDGKDYIVKGVMQPKIKSFNSVNELITNYNLTKELPEYVSNLIAAGLQYNDALKSLNMWLIFEAPNGKDLDRYIKDDISGIIGTTNPLLEKIYCSIKVAQNAVNSLGYIHRDIKPANVFVELNDDGIFRRCKLIDLGATVKAGSVVPFGGTVLYSPYHNSAAALSYRINGLKTILNDINEKIKLATNNPVELYNLQSRYDRVNMQLESLEAEIPTVINAGTKKYRNLHKSTASTFHNNFSVNTIWSQDFKQAAGTQPKCEAPSTAVIAPGSPTLNGRQRLPPIAPRPTLAQLAAATGIANDTAFRPPRELLPGIRLFTPTPGPIASALRERIATRRLPPISVNKKGGKRQRKQNRRTYKNKKT
jgi:hypothetical protein